MTCRARWATEDRHLLGSGRRAETFFRLCWERFYAQMCDVLVRGETQVQAMRSFVAKLHEYEV